MKQRGYLIIREREVIAYIEGDLKKTKRALKDIVKDRGQLNRLGYYLIVSIEERYNVVN